MTDLTEAARYLREIEQEARTAEALKRIRVERRRNIMQHAAVWTLIAVAVAVYGPAIIRTAQAVWRG